MKLILMIGILLVTTVAQAGLIDSAMTSNWPVKPSTKYKIDMYGYDARAYEFKTDNGMNCVVVFPGGTATGFQMQCMPADNQKDQKK